jgi:hypothetical protein
MVIIYFDKDLATYVHTRTMLVHHPHMEEYPRIELWGIGAVYMRKVAEIAERFLRRIQSKHIKVFVACRE